MFFSKSLPDFVHFHIQYVTVQSLAEFHKTDIEFFAKK